MPMIHRLTHRRRSWLSSCSADDCLQTTILTKDDRLVGAHMMLWGVPFYLHLLPTPVTPQQLPASLTSDDTRLIRQGMTQVYNTRDDKNRQVKSHTLKFTYPK